MLFKLESLSLEFGEKVIFDKIDFIFNSGDRVGIVGDNGVGKSTFFNVILKRIDFNGDLILDNDNFGFLSQDDSFEELKLISSRKEEIEKLLIDDIIINDSDKYNNLLNEYNDLILNSTSSLNEDELISGFNFNKELFEKEIKDNFSGGETTKLKLIKLFSNDFDYYLLDEPSNHLDIQSKNYLIKKLNNINTFLLISHDVDLLNKTCNKILEIKNSKINVYTGNYDNYLVVEKRERDEISKTIIEKTREKNKIQNNIDRLKSWSAQKVKDKSKHLAHGQVLSNLGIGRGSMDSGIQETSKKLNKMFDKQDLIDLPEQDREDEIKIKYLYFEKPNEIVLKIKNLTKSFENSVKNKNISSKHFEEDSKSFNLNINDFELLESEKVAIQGNNGSGKSTFLKLIIKEIKEDSGIIEIGDKIKLGYLSQKNETLNFENTILEEIFILDLNFDESEIRKYLGKFLFKKNDVFKKIKDLSGGEKIRLALLKLIISGCNFLVLDEPSNHLDIRSKNILSTALNDYPGAILCVSHDDYFLDKFVTKKIQMVNGELV